MTPTRPLLSSNPAAGWRRSWTCRSFRACRMSYPWLSLRATRSRGCASGLPVVACRRIGRGCIRGRRVAVVVVGCGGSCGRNEAARENTEGSRPMMEPAPLVLESRRLSRFRPGCDSATASSHRRADRRARWRRWRVRGCLPRATSQECEGVDIGGITTTKKRRGHGQPITVSGTSCCRLQMLQSQQATRLVPQQTTWRRAAPNSEDNAQRHPFLENSRDRQKCVQAPRPVTCLSMM